MTRFVRGCAIVLILLLVVVVGIDYSYGQRKEVWREVYRNDGYIWAYDARSVRLFGLAEGCADKPYVEVWLSIVNRQRGNYDRIRVQLAADTREYRFTDSIGYDAGGDIGEL